ncbi:MAG TPA: 50S ribosomal protein L10 [Flavobacteriaceae bacterium]|nr:50S ribosomal protein L10 [Flavobacteriaceae bacterium]
MKTRKQKSQVIEDLTAQLNDNQIIYLADISGLNAADTTLLRRACYKANVSLTMVKNTMLDKAIEQADKDLGQLSEVLKGSTSIMFSETGNAPAKVIQEFRKKSKKQLPLLKGAFVEEAIYIGDENLDALVNIKSKEEVIGDIIGLLQSPAKNVISALKSGGGKIAGIVKTLSERKE